MCTSVDWMDPKYLVACGQDGRAHLVALREVRASRRPACAR